MTYDALRRGRCSLAGYAYHVTVVTAGRQPVFADFECARLAIREMRRCDATAQTKTLAWVLMPDHLHWLFILGVQASLARLIHDFKGRSARRLNRHRQTTGPLWQRAYHDHAVRSDEDVHAIARYIVANPLRAGLVEKIGQYSHWDAAWL